MLIRNDKKIPLMLGKKQKTNLPLFFLPIVAVVGKGEITGVNSFSKSELNIACLLFLDYNLTRKLSQPVNRCCCSVCVGVRVRACLRACMCILCVKAKFHNQTGLQNKMKLRLQLILMKNV